MKKENTRQVIDEALSKLTRKHGDGTVMRMGEAPTQSRDGISTGSIGLDLATGCSGYPRGRVVEIYGPESSGKTTLTLHAISNCQPRAVSQHLSMPSMHWTQPTRRPSGWT